ncbi:HAD family hydrolase [Veronia pacifica]|uniref:HAD family hydrolase n=1 Tax=Veronia pacifica TaxID=1080227 RepID=A0A1C3EBP6_9GAMM|nr:HAD family hydrolase [Veronia pacifica]ODA30663.1 hypothetical protein A8L45_19505 [Veronia pacifica]
MNIDLVIFDCDGVLVDSETITARVFCDMLRELGFDADQDDIYHRFVGQSGGKGGQILENILGYPAPDTFFPELNQRVMRALKAEVAPIEGVPEALDQLSLPYCVASNGKHQKMETTLMKSGLYQQFEGKIFSAEDVKLAKPAPDVYLYAAQSMGVVPSRCLVVEDTVTGVKAGVAAGMTVLGFCALSQADKLKEAGAIRVMFNMHELPTIVTDLQ